MIAATSPDVDEVHLRRVKLVEAAEDFANGRISVNEFDKLEAEYSPDLDEMGKHLYRVSNSSHQERKAEILALTAPLILVLFGLGLSILGSYFESPSIDSLSYALMAAAVGTCIGWIVVYARRRLG